MCVCANECMIVCMEKNEMEREGERERERVRVVFSAFSLPNSKVRTICIFLYTKVYLTCLWKLMPKH